MPETREHDDREPARCRCGAAMSEAERAAYRTCENCFAFAAERYCSGGGTRVAGRQIATVKEGS